MSTAERVKGVSGPGVVGAIFRLAGVRFPVVSSNHMRISSQVMPVLSSVVGVKVTLFQKVKSSCRKSACVCHSRWQLISVVADICSVEGGLPGSA